MPRLTGILRHHPVNAITMAGIVREGALTLEQFRGLP
jgi:hypothetical protein